MVQKLKSPRRLVALAAFAIVAMSAFGFAAANTVPGSHAGDGVGTVSGGTVSAIDYTVSGSPAVIDAVDFNFASASAPRVVEVTLVGAGASATCDVSGLPAVTCDFTGEAAATREVADVIQLQVTSWD